MPKVVLVTGASSGLGRATADLLAGRGWTVIGASRRGSAGAGWSGLVMDVDDDASVAAGVTGLLADHGRVDAIVCAAGHGLAGPVETTSMAEAKAQLETNFFGTVRVVQALLPALREQSAGRIMVLSSIGGEIGLPFQAYYCASKFALEGWAESLAYEVAPFGVHVTLVQPGNFTTDFTASRRLATAGLGAYAAACGHAISVMEEDERNGAAPRQVAEVIARQLESASPRRRISVGKADERLGLLAKRVLPHSWFEKAARSSLGVT